MANIRKVVRQRVAELMARDGVSPAGLARVVDKSRAWATQFLKGNRGTTLDVVEELAAFFHVEPADFLQDRYDSSDAVPIRHGADGKPVLYKAGVDVASQAEARALRSENEQLKRELATALEALRVIHEQASTARTKVSAARKAQPARSKNRRSAS